MKLVLFIFGLAICVFSHPKVMRFFMSRLMNEGMVTPKTVRREDAEIVKYAGPNLSLFFVGVVLMIVSFLINNR